MVISLAKEHRRMDQTEASATARETGRIEGDSFRLRTILFQDAEDQKQVWGNGPLGSQRCPASICGQGVRGY